MNTNMGLLDRIIRLVLVAVIFYAYFAGWIYEGSAYILAFVAAALIGTALSGDCYLYNWLNISTKKRKNRIT